MSKCRVCGRALRSMQSIQRGVGPGCAGKVRMVIQDEFQEKPIKIKDYNESFESVKKAEELLKNENEKNKIFRKMHRTEKKIRENSYETGFVYNNINGNKLWEHVGNKDSVDISDASQKGFLKGNILTHNHPRGTSLSFPDIAVLVYHDMKEIRAVGKDYIHSMKVNHQAFNPFETNEEKLIKIKAAYEHYNKEVRQEFTQKIKNGEITIDYAESNHQHEVWTRMQKNENYLIYERKKWNGR